MAKKTTKATTTRTRNAKGTTTAGTPAKRPRKTAAATTGGKATPTPKKGKGSASTAPKGKKATIAKKGKKVDAPTTMAAATVLIREPKPGAVASDPAQISLDTYLETAWFSPSFQRFAKGLVLKAIEGGATIENGSAQYRLAGSKDDLDTLPTYDTQRDANGQIALTKSRATNGYTGSTTALDNGTNFKVVYDPNNAKHKKAFESLQGLGKRVITVLANDGRGTFTRTDIRNVVEENREAVRSKQEAWHIFDIWRKRFVNAKLIEEVEAAK